MRRHASAVACTIGACLSSDGPGWCCLVEVAPEVRKAVVAASFGSPQLIEAGSFAEAEDIFDSLVGHMAGRAQPTEPPSTEDWSLLFGQALAYLRAEPWVRWSDVVGSDGPSELAGADAQRLQMALAAVLAIDSRGPVLAAGARATTGRVALADGTRGTC